MREAASQCTEIAEAHASKRFFNKLLVVVHPPSEYLNVIKLLFELYCLLKMSEAFPNIARSSANHKCITPGALRMRASRQRRRDGLRCITLDLREAEIDQLIDLGHLRNADRDDKNQVLLALYRFLDESSLGVAHR